MANIMRYKCLGHGKLGLHRAEILNCFSFLKNKMLVRSKFTLGSWPSCFLDGRALNHFTLYVLVSVVYSIVSAMCLFFS